jgi:enamine deaminase RidA (YjgF/YER057c/UK114 family)
MHMSRELIDPGWDWAKRLNISALLRVGNTIYLSGTVALDRDGNVVGSDTYSQSQQVFRNIKEALACAGASMSDVVKITSYLTDMSACRDFSMARTEAFPDGVPESAVYGTLELVKPELMVEVETIAVLRRKL